MTCTSEIPKCNQCVCPGLFASFRNTGVDGRGYLARTYYAEVEYVLPGAVMQPVWSSVKHPDGSVDFGLSYHRAFYSPDYDDYHDIYIQRFTIGLCLPLPFHAPPAC